MIIGTSDLSRQNSRLISVSRLTCTPYSQRRSFAPWCHTWRRWTAPSCSRSAWWPPRWRYPGSHSGCPLWPEKHALSISTLEMFQHRQRWRIVRGWMLTRRVCQLDGDFISVSFTHTWLDYVGICQNKNPVTRLSHSRVGVSDLHHDRETWRCDLPNDTTVHKISNTNTVATCGCLEN